jgi:hypothetical protein
MEFINCTETIGGGQDKSEFVELKMNIFRDGNKIKFINTAFITVSRVL